MPIYFNILVDKFLPHFVDTTLNSGLMLRSLRRLALIGNFGIHQSAQLYRP